jgi:hypothetical protein
LSIIVVYGVVIGMTGYTINSTKSLVVENGRYPGACVVTGDTVIPIVVNRL